MSRYKINEENTIKYYQIPKELLTNPLYKGLNNDARVLYSVLRDRMELSRKNNWVNDDGEIYLIFSRENISELIGVSLPTVTKAFKQALKFGLIEEERQGQGKPNLIYICHLKLQSIDSCYTKPHVKSKTEKVLISEFKDIEYPTNKIFNGNETDINKTDLNTTTTQTDVVVDNLTTKITSTIKANIKLSTVSKLISDVGIERVEYYIDNWDRFKYTKKTNIIGFFIKAIVNEYDLPTQEEKSVKTDTVEQVNNFKQREYDEDEFEQYYSNK